MTSQMKFIFFDKNAEHIHQYELVLNHNCIVCDVEWLINTGKLDIIVSPANSHGIMDGGIDLVYSRLFDGIQNTVQNKIRDVGVLSDWGYWALPIGKTVIVETKNELCGLLACTPTMTLPGNINGTDNIYQAMRGLLAELKNYPQDYTVGIPCLGTGIGCVHPIESATQIKRAVLE